MRELIDTLWNVNMAFATTQISVHTRINRYIMECKFIYIIFRINGFCELIDTLWNVNEQAVEPHRDNAGRINRYIMECK